MLKGNLARATRSNNRNQELLISVQGNVWAFHQCSSLEPMILERMDASMDCVNVFVRPLPTRTEVVNYQMITNTDFTNTMMMV